MKTIRIPANQTLIYTENILKAAGIKCGSYIPYWKNDEREQLRISGKMISKKAYEEMGYISFENAVRYCEEKECQIFLHCTNSKEKEEYPEISGLKTSSKKQTFNYRNYKGLEIQNIGANEPSYAAKAIEIAEDIEMGENRLKKAIFEADVFFGIKKVNNKPVIIETSVWNTEMAKEVVETVNRYYKDKKLVFTVGFTKDVQIDEISEILFEHAYQILTFHLPLHNDAVSAYELAMEIKDINGNVTETGSRMEAMELAKLLAAEESIIICIN